MNQNYGIYKNGVTFSWSSGVVGGNEDQKWRMSSHREEYNWRKSAFKK